MNKKQITKEDIKKYRQEHDEEIQQLWRLYISDGLGNNDNSYQAKFTAGFALARLSSEPIGFDIESLVLNNEIEIVTRKKGNRLYAGSRGAKFVTAEEKDFTIDYIAFDSFEEALNSLLTRTTLISDNTH